MTRVPSIMQIIRNLWAGQALTKSEIMGGTQGETSVCVRVLPRPVRASVCIFILLVADWVVKVSSDSGNKPTDDLHPVPIGENWPEIVPTEDDQLSTTWSTTSIVSCAVLFVAVVVLVTAAIIAAVYIRSER